jgi:hypothetical protein
MNLKLLVPLDDVFSTVTLRAVLVLHSAVNDCISGADALVIVRGRNEDEYYYTVPIESVCPSRTPVVAAFPSFP